MEKFIPYEKLSKKKKRKLDQARRQTWNSLSPVTRKPANSKAYNRSKARNWMRDDQRTDSGIFVFLASYANSDTELLLFHAWLQRHTEPMDTGFLPAATARTE